MGAGRGDAARRGLKIHRESLKSFPDSLRGSLSGERDAAFLPAFINLVPL